MLRKTSRSFIIFLLSGAVASIAASPVLAVSAQQTAVDYVESGLRQYRIPGASLIITKDNKKVIDKNWGETTNGNAVTSDTPFQIGSLSKTFTALAILQLEQRSIVKLDEPIDTYLPDFQYSSPANTSITVRQLLDHKSGIGAVDGLEITDRKYSKDHGIRDAVGTLSGIELQTKPGESYAYTSANYLLLGRIIEVTTGKSYAAYMKDAIFKPLSMERTAASADEADRTGLQPGYHSWFGNPVKGSGFYDNAGTPYGYISSTTADLTKFLAFMYTGSDKVLANSQLQKLKQRPSGDSTYKLGWHYSKDGSYFYHGGATPEFRAEMFYYPDRNFSGVILTNKYNSLEDQQVSAIMSGARDSIGGRSPQSLPSQPYYEQWAIGTLSVVALAGGLVHVYRIFTKKISSHRCRYGIGTILVLLGLLIVIYVPVLFGAPWHSLLLFAPDIAYGLMLISVLVALNGIVFFMRTSSKSRA